MTPEQREGRLQKRASESAQQKEKTSSGSSGSPQTRPCMSLVYYYYYILYIIYGTSVTRAPLYTMYSNSRYIPEAAWRNFCALRYRVHNHCWVSKTDTLCVRTCLEKGKVKWLQTLIAILVMLPLYLECLAIESSEQRKASGTLWLLCFQSVWRTQECL